MNRIVVMLSQNTSKLVTHNGVQKKIDVLRKPVEFVSETKREVTAENAGCWLADVLRKWQLAAKLQGKEAFDMSCPVDMKITVTHGNHASTETMSVKIAISPNKLKSVLSKYPNLIGLAFVPDLNVADATRKNVTNRALIYTAKVDDKMLLDYGNVVLAKHVKELPAPKDEKPAEEIKDAELVNDGQVVPEVLTAVAEEVTINA